MSNLSIIERLELTLCAYERNELTRLEFVKFLTNSIQALEGMPYSVHLELRNHERDIETEGYFEDEGFESKTIQAREALKLWIQQLKELYGHGKC